MKIAILTSGILPVPAVQGGAVENLIDYYLEYNNQHHLHDIMVYSVFHPQAIRHPANLSQVNHYYFVKTNSWGAKIRRIIRKWSHPKGDYYNYFIEYFFEQVYEDLRCQQYDCIILENRPGYAKKLAERGINNLVLHLHNDLLNRTTPYHKQIFRTLNRIITVSDYIGKCVSTIQPSKKIITIHNGIDLYSFSHESLTVIRRSDIGFTNTDFVLVFSGRINKDKGIAELIDAMLLLHDLPNVKLLIIGSTFFGNATNEDDFVQALKLKAKSIKQRLVFTGFIPYNEMPSYLKLADIAIIPSVWDDPFPTTVLEAQAMGLPIICSNRGGITEEVDKDNAIIVPTEHKFVEGLASAIRYLYNSPQQRAIMAKASQRHSTHFNKERFAHDFFNALVSNHNK